MSRHHGIDRLQAFTRRALIDLCQGKVDLEGNAHKLGFASLDDALDHLRLKGRPPVSAASGDAVLRVINRLTDGHGVESLMRADGLKVAMSYVNQGDVWTPTVIWCGLRQRLYVCSFGDWLELRERWHGRWARDLRAA